MLLVRRGCGIHVVWFGTDGSGVTDVRFAYPGVGAAPTSSTALCSYDVDVHPQRVRPPSGNPVKIAKLDTGQEMAPFVHGKLANRTLRPCRIAYHDKLARACDLYALAIVAGT